MKTLRALHKWLGLLVFIQVLIWMGSGFVISLIDMESAAGLDSRKKPVAPEPLRDVLSIQDLAISRDGLQSINLTYVDQRPVYKLRYQKKRLLLDAQTGLVFSIDSERAERIALASYKGNASPVDVQRIEQPAALPAFNETAWRLSFDDSVGTRIFVDAIDGRLLAHRNDSSALVEFLLKLHFMDYDGGHDFNHPLIIGFAFATLWLVMTGLLLLIGGFRRLGVRYL